MISSELTVDQLKNILESLTDTVVVTDLQKVVTFCNQPVELLTGWKVPQIVSRPVFDTIHLLRKRDRSDNHDFFNQVLKLGQPSSPESALILISKTGKEIPIKVTATPLFNPQKKIIGAVLIIHNLTAEQESLTLQSDFSYLQHQLRAPISGAIWNLQLAIDQITSEPVKKNLLLAQSSVQTIQVISTKMIEASQIGQGLVNPVIQKVNLSDIISPLIKEVTLLAKENQVTLKTDIPKKEIELKTDLDLLSKTLKEILDNAIRYSPAKSPIYFKVSQKDKGLLFEIKDMGRGIPENELSLVFTKFFRGTNAMDQPGAGLGLHIALQYAKMIKSQIWFSSKQNLGTTFSVFTPTAPV